MHHLRGVAEGGVEHRLGGGRGEVGGQVEKVWWSRCATGASCVGASGASPMSPVLTGGTASVLRWRSQ